MKISLRKRSLSLGLIMLAASISVLANDGQLMQLETASGGRLGVDALNSANNSALQNRAHERFAFCSTAKLMIVAAILKESIDKPGLLQQKITYTSVDLVAHSPVTKQHLADGMTIADLCAATITQSDNTGANLLVKQLGGPQAVTAFAHSIDDKTFRLDGLEPNISTAIPGDIRNTTTPAAMTQDLQQLVLGNVLGASQQELLQTWLKNSKVGALRIRAGVPKSWGVGDKTGTGYYGTTNDIAVIWPPHCAPLVLTVYYTQNRQDAEPDNDIVAAATRIVISQFAKDDQCLRKALATDSQS